MSKELLKRIYDELYIINESQGIIGWHLNGDIEPRSRTEFPQIVEDIEYELAKPEPEPVAFVDMENWPPIRWADNYQLRGDIYPLNGMGLYTVQPDQSARIAELEQQLAEAKSNLDKADCEIDRLRTIHQTAHDRLLRGDSDKELLEILEGGWGDLRQDYFSRMQKAEQQLFDLQNKKAVLPSEDYISRFYVDEHTSLDDVIKSIWCDALDANGIKVGE